MRWQPIIPINDKYIFKNTVIFIRQLKEESLPIISFFTKRLVSFGMLNRFPNDRINNFCDAVFAIAMTLLILEIKIPSGEDLRAYETGGVLLRLIPSFIGFMISFFVIALYWRLHLTMAQFVKSYDNRLLWYNIWLLMSIVLLPFSTAFYAKYFNDLLSGTFVFYCINLMAIGMINFFMFNYIVHKEGYSETLTPSIAARFRSRIGIPPIIWALSIPLEFVEPWIARFLFVVEGIAQRRFEKREKRSKQQDG
jgi:uncharacterized membrane protein